jgi:hypothetical protein
MDVHLYTFVTWALREVDLSGYARFGDYVYGLDTAARKGAIVDKHSTVMEFP